MRLKAIIFDFDGTLVESMDIKARGFAHLFREYPDEVVSKVVKLHMDHGGMSRFEKFRIIYKEFLKKEITKEDEDRHDREFSEYCFDRMLKCPFVKGTVEFLEKFQKDLLFFVVSGIPHQEINDLVDGRNLRKYFKGVWGTPRKKTELCKMVIEENNLNSSEVVLVGDSLTDLQGAEGAGIPFIARLLPADSPFKSGEHSIKYSLYDLSELEELLIAEFL